MIHVERRDSLALLRFDHGRANVIDRQFLRLLIDAIDAVAESDARGVVVTGNGKIFSAGVDLLQMIEGGKEYIDEFLPLLSEALAKLFAFARPVVAAVDGHAIAGGCIFVCAADLRLMAEGSARIGVPEIHVGVPFPTVALEIMRFATGGRNLPQIVYSGETYAPPAALRLGLVDEIVDAAELLPRALEHARRLATLPRETFTTTKRQLRAAATERIERRQSVDDPAIATIWKAPATLAAVQAYVERVLLKKT